MSGIGIQTQPAVGEPQGSLQQTGRQGPWGQGGDPHLQNACCVRSEWSAFLLGRAQLQNSSGDRIVVPLPEQEPRATILGVPL